MGDKRKVCVVSAHRSERGLLEPVLKRIKQHPNLELSLLEVKSEWTFGTLADYAKSWFKRLEPDIVVVPTDRSEMIPVALTSFYMNIPTFHLYGGTFGSGIHDEFARFIISKCSHIIFCEDDEAKEALVKMGEEWWRCIVVGVTHFDDFELDESVVPKEPYDLFLIHPDTFSAENTKRDVEEAVSLLDKYTIIIEPNREKFYNIILDAVSRLSYPTYTHLPRPQFLALVKHAERFITNSSSAIYEAPYLETKEVVMIGERNRSRKPVKVLTGASDRIVKVLAEIELNDKLIRKRLSVGA